MRFGRTLALSIYKPWQDQYIDYAKLKKLLREDDSAPNSPSTETQDEWTEDDESKFVHELVNVQLEKVHAFHQDMYTKLENRTTQCESKLDSVTVTDKAPQDVKHTDHAKVTNGKANNEAETSQNGNGKKAVPSEAEATKVLKEVLSELNNITKETNELEKYSRLNYTGFLKAVKKHDRKRGQAYRLRPLLQVRLAALPFNKEDYGPLLFRLSTMYTFARQRLDGIESNDSNANDDVLEGKEDYVTHKFWVHPENLMEVKTMILRRLPVLVYKPKDAKVVDGTQPDPTLTSIYFDNPTFPLYTKKVDHGEASSLRLRWYGPLESAESIWVEKKTVSGDNKSSESRFTTKEKHVQRFLKGEYHMEKQIQKLTDRMGGDNEQVQNIKSSVEEIQTFIKENDLQPMLRANYNRTAFQIPGDDRVRISIDTNLAFIREDALDERPCRDPEAWHRTDIDNAGLTFPFSSIRKGELTRFPYAVLEIKLLNSGKRREWVEELTNSHLVKPAPRFSKFVHGVASLFEDYVNTFPFWLSDMETDIRRDPFEAFEEEQAKKRKELDDEWAVGSFLKTRSSLGALRHSSPGLISPVGSPSAAQLKSQRSFGTTPTLRSELNHSIAAESTKLKKTAEEPDQDETDRQVRQGNSTAAAGFKSFLPSFSNLPSLSKSKYARALRARAQLPPGVHKPTFWLKDSGPVKVEGKVWLANQRTYMKWQHISILLAGLSVVLYNAAGRDNHVARALAIVYLVLAVAAAVWGYYIYTWRIHLIKTRSGKDFDAVLGPAVVCVGLLAALIINFALQYRRFLQPPAPVTENPLVVQMNY